MARTKNTGKSPPVDAASKHPEKSTNVEKKGLSPPRNITKPTEQDSPSDSFFNDAYETAALQHAKERMAGYKEKEIHYKSEITKLRNSLERERKERERNERKSAASKAKAVTATPETSKITKSTVLPTSNLKKKSVEFNIDDPSGSPAEIPLAEATVYNTPQGDVNPSAPAKKTHDGNSKKDNDTSQKKPPPISTDSAAPVTDLTRDAPDIAETDKRNEESAARAQAYREQVGLAVRKNMTSRWQLQPSDTAAIKLKIAVTNLLGCIYKCMTYFERKGANPSSEATKRNYRKITVAESVKGEPDVIKEMEEFTEFQRNTREQEELHVRSIRESAYRANIRQHLTAVFDTLRDVAEACASFYLRNWEKLFEHGHFNVRPPLMNRKVDTSFGLEAISRMLLDKADGQVFSRQALFYITCRLSTRDGEPNNDELHLKYRPLAKSFLTKAREKWLRNLQKERIGGKNWKLQLETMRDKQTQDPLEFSVTSAFFIKRLMTDLGRFFDTHCIEHARQQRDELTETIRLVIQKVQKEGGTLEKQQQCIETAIDRVLKDNAKKLNPKNESKPASVPKPKPKTGKQPAAPRKNRDDPKIADSKKPGKKTKHKPAQPTHPPTTQAPAPAQQEVQGNAYQGNEQRTSNNYPPPQPNPNYRDNHRHNSGRGHDSGYSRGFGRGRGRRGRGRGRGGRGGRGRGRGRNSYHQPHTQNHDHNHYPQQEYPPPAHDDYRHHDYHDDSGRQYNDDSQYGRSHGDESQWKRPHDGYDDRPYSPPKRARQDFRRGNGPDQSANAPRR